MPLRDHFHPPLSRKHSWEVLHGQWPAVIVQQLRSKIPDDYFAGPRVHHGARGKKDFLISRQFNSFEDYTDGGVAMATWIAPPDIRVKTELDDFDAYEVNVYDDQRDQRLVAAIEIVSPANKELQAGVAVSIVDVVTERQFNLYADLMQFIGHPVDATQARPGIYAASCRWVQSHADTFFESWSHTLTIGQPLPQLPLWLAEALVVPLDLEQSYEAACRDLWIA